MSKKRHSTSTLNPDGTMVPWLAANGPLAYSPENPPERDYYFQYSWIIPNVFNKGVNKREHYWFGYPYKDNLDVKQLLSFWESTRANKTEKIYSCNGTFGPNDLTAPMAIYRHRHLYSPTKLFHFIQHGSYQMIHAKSQPHLADGHVILYRGIQNESVYKMYRPSIPITRRGLYETHAETLVDSVLSFNTVHCNVTRSETCYLNDRSLIFSSKVKKHGLSTRDFAIGSLFYSGYSLEEWCAVRKFGPNYIKFKTPVNNIRITTFLPVKPRLRSSTVVSLRFLMPLGARSRRYLFKMKLITDLLEIARLSKRNRKANFDFRAKLKWRVDNVALLDSQVHALYKEIANKIDCRTCGNCCKTYDIIVTDTDISRLSKALGMATDEFMSQYLNKAEDGDELCFKTRPCPFLKNNTCSQCENRPAVCREYPHLDKNEFLGRTWSAIDNCSTCPQVFNVWERLKREFNFR